MENGIDNDHKPIEHIEEDHPVEIKEELMDYPRDVTNEDDDKKK